VGWTILGFGVVVLVFTALLHVVAGLTIAEQTTPWLLFYLGLPTLEVILVGTLVLFRKWVPMFIAVGLIDLLNFWLIGHGSIGLG
jgi:hypothetical protein